MKKTNSHFKDNLYVNKNDLSKYVKSRYMKSLMNDLNYNVKRTMVQKYIDTYIYKSNKISPKLTFVTYYHIDDIIEYLENKLAHTRVQKRRERLQSILKSMGKLKNNLLSNS